MLALSSGLSFVILHKRMKQSWEQLASRRFPLSEQIITEILQVSNKLIKKLYKEDQHRHQKFVFCADSVSFGHFWYSYTSLKEILSNDMKEPFNLTHCWQLRILQKETIQLYNTVSCSGWVKLNCIYCKLGFEVRDDTVTYQWTVDYSNFVNYTEKIKQLHGRFTESWQSIGNRLTVSSTAGHKGKLLFLIPYHHWQTLILLSNLHVHSTSGLWEIQFPLEYRDEFSCHPHRLLRLGL